MEVVASLSQGRTAAAQFGLFTHKSVPVIFEPTCTYPSFCFKDACNLPAHVNIHDFKLPQLCFTGRGYALLLSYFFVLFLRNVGRPCDSDTGPRPRRPECKGVLYLLPYI